MNLSFYNGISGVKTQQFGIDTWGNNIANVNTIGYKYSDPQFASILSQAVHAVAIEGFDEVGLGSTAQATALNFQQGIVKNTDREFDLAIQGKGFFGVIDGDGVMNYTRNGAMYVNGSGYLVDQYGNFVLGQKAPNLTVNQSDLSATVTADNTQPTMSSPGSMQKIQIPLTVTHPGKPGIPEERTTNLVGSFDYTKGVPMDYNFYVSADTVPTITVTDDSGIERGKLYLDSAKRGNHDKVWDGKVSDPVNLKHEAMTEVVSLTPISLPSGSITINGISIDEVTLTSVDADENAQVIIDAINSKNSDTRVTASMDSTGKIVLNSDDGATYITMDLSGYAETVTGLNNASSPDLVITGGSKPVALEPIVITDGDFKINDISIGAVSLESTDSLTNAQALADAINAIQGSTGVTASVDTSGKIILTGIDDAALSVVTSNGAAEKTGFDTTDGDLTKNSNYLDSGKYTFTIEYVSKVATPDIPEGNFAQYQIDVNGKLIAQFDNGMESTIAQIPVYQFQNEQGLTKVGDSLFQVSDNSGQAFFYEDSTGSYTTGGTIMASSLEMSNVSLATALTELMVTQKAFDANAKSITTSDQMIQRAINLKRG